jgi:hypothetical protein
LKYDDEMVKFFFQGSNGRTTLRTCDSIDGVFFSQNLQEFVRRGDCGRVGTETAARLETKSSGKGEESTFFFKKKKAQSFVKS